MGIRAALDGLSVGFCRPPGTRHSSDAPLYLPAMYRITFLTGPSKGRRVLIREGRIDIGRDEHCPIKLEDDATVGFRHAVLDNRGREVWISQAGSLWHVRVNRLEIETCRLRHGDEIQMGKTRLLFQELHGVVGEKGRRISHVQGLTITAVAIVLALEAIYILGSSLFRQGAFMEEERLMDSTTVTAAVPGSGIGDEIGDTEPASEDPLTPAPVLPEPADTAARLNLASVCIGAVDIATEPWTNGLDLLRVFLELGENIEADKINVDVLFYRLNQADKIEPVPEYVPDEWLRSPAFADILLPPAEIAGSGHTLWDCYVIPGQEYTVGEGGGEGGSATPYAGYHVRLFYANELRDEKRSVFEKSPGRSRSVP